MRDHFLGPDADPVTPAGYTPRQLAFIVTAHLVAIVVLFAFAGAATALGFVLGLALGLVCGVTAGAYLKAHAADAENPDGPNA